MPLGIFDEHVAINLLQLIETADGTSPKSIVQAPAGGLRIDQLTLTNSDVISHDVQFTVFASVTVVLGTVAVPAGAGLSAAVPPVDAMPILAPVLGGLVLSNGVSLFVAVLVVMGAASTLTILGLGGEF